MFQNVKRFNIICLFIFCLSPALQLNFIWASFLLLPPPQAAFSLSAVSLRSFFVYARAGFSLLFPLLQHFKKAEQQQKRKGSTVVGDTLGHPRSTPLLCPSSNLLCFSTLLNSSRRGKNEAPCVGWTPVAGNTADAHRDLIWGPSV